MDQSVYDLGRAQYRDAVGISDMDRDKDGFLVLRPTARHVDQKVASLTTDIDTLEEKLRQFREQKAQAVKYQKSEEYRESKKKDKNKKQKKERTTLLEMVFNNADAINAEAEGEEDEDGYRDTKKRGPKKTTLDTTYGKRFAPVVSMLYDTITDFDRIAREIDDELKSSRGQTRGMYRSSQISNYISAKNSRLSAVKELGSIAKQVSDLEYKREKDKRAVEGSDSTKAITSLGAKFLRGSLDFGSDSGKKSGGKKDKGKGKGKDKGKSNFSKTSKEMGYDPDDEDDGEEESVRRPKDTASDKDLAKELARTVLKRKDDFSFSPHERHLSMEGKYAFVVACDPMDPEHTWKFIAVDPKTGKELKDFKENYKELYPKKKNVRPRFDVSKKKMTDLNTSKVYKLVFTD